MNFKRVHYSLILKLAAKSQYSTQLYTTLNVTFELNTDVLNMCHLEITEKLNRQKQLLVVLLRLQTSS